MKKPNVQYEELKENLIKQIDNIDFQTGYSAKEPEWWIEMMELRSHIKKLIRNQEQ